MDYKKPLYVTFHDEKSGHRGNHVFLNMKSSWNDFKNEVKFLAKQDFDYIAINYADNCLQNPNNLKGLNIKTNELSKLATRHNAACITYEDGQIYRLNAKRFSGESYVVSNNAVLDKYNSFENNDAWQKHQADVWSRFGKINGLNNSSFGEDHLKLLTDQSRGLNQNDIRDFFSIRSGTTLNPAILQDNLVGMPGVNARSLNDSYFDDKGRLISNGQLSLSQIGSGYIIPMKNKNGDMAKFQIGSDVTEFNITVKARASDGVTVQSSEIYDKKTNTYTFKCNGEDSQLKCIKANNTQATFEDLHGQFTVNLKADIKNTLIGRGYEIPELIDRLNVLPRSKYAWPAPGNMVGVASDGVDVPKLVSPSDAGFINVRDGEKYTLLVVEGALKGHITAKYLNDDNVSELTNQISNDGLIVAQVPGVAKAFIESVKNIYDKYDFEKTIIAMDADGRYNKSVAKGIHDSVEILSAHTPVSVMSWNPEQKGIDDALIALSRKQITLDDFDVTFGTAEELFPLKDAKSPNPYRLDGSRANSLDWQETYSEAVSTRNKIKQNVQEKSASTQTNYVEYDEEVKIDESEMKTIQNEEISQADVKLFMEEITKLTQEIQRRTDEFASRL